MRAISVPFRFDNGVVASTIDPATIARDQLLNVIVTNQLERAMRPFFGANLRGVIFDAMNETNLAEARMHLMTAAQRAVTVGSIVNVNFRVTDSQPSSFYIDVYFTIPPDNTVHVASTPLSGIVIQGDVL